MSKSCPYCKSKQRNRTDRSGILKNIPMTAFYRCMKCNGYYYFIPLFYRSYKYKKSDSDNAG
ncbi:MAG: hypothetical protein P8Q27_01625 [Flavicella sp.]|nr:hypothetical protein [Flavicella sp.]